jgi:hypothetical protein
MRLHGGGSDRHRKWAQRVASLDPIRNKNGEWRPKFASLQFAQKKERKLAPTSVSSHYRGRHAEALRQA